jgi:predicted enzyme related to lactoylglutathione lyase
MSKFEGNAVTWFEIPTTDIARATTFYETILDKKLIPWPGEEPYFLFPTGTDGVGGALMYRPHQKPTAQGTMVFLNVDGQLDAVLTRAHKIEGTVLLPKTQIPNGAFYACIQDSEGNHVGLHSR